MLEGMTLLEKHSPHIINLKIKIHTTLSNLTRGGACRADMDRLISALNVSEALYRLGFGADYDAELRQGLDALYAVCSRGAATDKYILKADEMKALNDAIDLHDAQLEVVTVKDMEKAVILVEAEMKAKKAKVIKK
jgi:hypothetical protein